MENIPVNKRTAHLACFKLFNKKTVKIEENEGQVYSLENNNNDDDDDDEDNSTKEMGRI